MVLKCTETSNVLEKALYEQEHLRLPTFLFKLLTILDILIVIVIVIVHYCLPAPVHGVLSFGN